MTNEAHLTAEEVAKRLRVTTRTLETWRDERRGPAFMQISKRKVLYSQADVLAYENSVRVAPIKEGDK